MLVIGDHQPRNLRYTLLLSREDVDILDDYQHGGTIVGADTTRCASFYITDTFLPPSPDDQEFRYNHAMGGYLHCFSFSDVTDQESLEKKLHGLKLPLTMDGADPGRTITLGTVRVELDYLKKLEPWS